MLGKAMAMIGDLGPMMSQIARGDGAWGGVNRGITKREKRRAEKKKKKLHRKQGRH